MTPQASTLSAPAAPSANAVQLLDCADVAEWLKARGMKGLRGPLTAKAIRYWAADGKIPMWTGPAGRLVITEVALNAWIAREQAQAQRAAEQRGAARTAPTPRRKSGRR